MGWISLDRSVTPLQPVNKLGQYLSEIGDKSCYGGFMIIKMVDLSFSKWWIYDYQNGGFKIFKMVDL